MDTVFGVIAEMSKTKTSADVETVMQISEFRDSVLQQIDYSIPPYFIPNKEQLSSQTCGLNNSSYKIIEPYSELEDYLDRDDFSNLLGILGHYADKSASGILSFGEGIFNNFVYKLKKRNTEEELDENVYESITSKQK